MASPLSPSRLIGNLVALALAPLFLAFLYDQLASWLGYQPFAFCWLAQPIVNLAGSIGVLVTSIGVVIYGLSRFRSEGALALTIGGVLLLVVPLVFGHYLSVVCIP